MNASSSGVWDIPPPPGTEDDQRVSDSPKLNFEPPPRVIDSIDPYLKSSQYLEYEKKSGRHRRHSRSRSNDRYEKRRRSRSRSKSRHRYRRSRSSSRLRSHRKRRYSKSRSRSRSRNRNKHSRKGRERKSWYSRARHFSGSRSKYSRSRSRSRSEMSESQSKSHKPNRSGKSSSEHSDYEEKPALEDANYELIDMKVEEEEPDQSAKDNAFKNDGSFLEMFKKMQEEKKAKEEAQKADAEKQKLLPAFGKRRGGRVLKTGMVLKTKPQDNDENVHDPWSVYMKEVKRYKEACCDDDSKTRPLVK